jgi:hypothetical protein
MVGGAEEKYADGPEVCEKAEGERRLKASGGDRAAAEATIDAEPNSSFSLSKMLPFPFGAETLTAGNWLSRLVERRWGDGKLARPG